MKWRAWIASTGCVLASAVLAAPAPLKTTATGRGPTLLLLHSLGGTSATWKPTVEKLTGYRVMVADLPGHGATPLPEPFSLDAAAEQVAATIATLEAESTVVVGQGMGGVLALKALAAHPRRVRGLVLIDVSVIGSQQASGDQQAAMLMLLEQNYKAFLKVTFGRLGRDSVQSAEIRAEAARVPPATIKAYIPPLLTLDAQEELRRAQVPILALVTERIWSADKDSTLVMKQMGYEGATNLRLVRVPEAGFLVATERPDTLAALLRSFTTRVLRP